MRRKRTTVLEATFNLYPRGKSGTVCALTAALVWAGSGTIRTLEA